MKEENFKNCMSKLCAALIFDLSEKSMAEYYRILKHIPDDQFPAICEAISVDFQPTSYKRFPTIGDFKAQRAAICRRIDENYSEAPVEGRASADEARAFLFVLEEIRVWHYLKLVTSNPDGCSPMYLEEWMSAGRPATWSPCIDYLYNMLCNDIGGHLFVQICTDYLGKLRSERTKRMAQKQEVEHAEL